MQAKLLLDDGTIMKGKSYGSQRESHGEIVFNTGVTGYQEVISDPTNAGQLIVMTQPLIGNYGLSRMNIEAVQPLIQGLVVREVEEIPSNWRGNYPLHDMLCQYDIPAISGIDTRMLTRLIRDKGVKRGLLTTSSETDDVLLARLQASKPHVDLVAQVTTKQLYTIPGVNEKIVIIDYGMKKGILHELIKRGCHITVVPYHTPAEHIIALQPDGIMLSNGPGDPAELGDVLQTITTLLQQYPLFGIGLGHQLFALACGAKTEEMNQGHRGSNQPVKNLITGQCTITSQNHGYVVKADSLQQTELQVTHVNNNDRSVEGLKHVNYAAFSVQFHPEGSPGPLNDYLYDEFIAMIRKHKLERQSQPLQARMYAELVKEVR